MNDIINLNSIKSGGCDCNKPKKQPCGCLHKEPCYSTTSGDLYFKVKNLFSELKSEWQRAEARTNLGVTDIIKLDLIKYGKGSGDSNVWQMVVAKGGSQRVYDFVVNNGDSGESATIEVGDVYTTDETPVIRNVGSESHAILNFGIPRGKEGVKGDKGLSAYDIYVKNGGLLDEAAWLKSLKGEPGKPGDPGKDGINGDLIKSVSIVDYSQYTKEFLDDKKITANMFIWRITLKDGRSFDFWVPEGTGGSGGVVSVGKPTFLYKLVKFNSKPTSAELTSKLAELQNEVNKDNSGRTVEYLTENKGWRKTSFVLSEPGYEFIYLATSVITEDNVEPWVVTQLTGAQGELGPQGPSGTGGSDGQGLIGPVIRMRGTYIEGNCYVNLSQQAQQGTTIRFIDIVFHNNSYWKVSDNVTGCASGAPSDSNSDWVKATEFDFAYINTLIANYLKTYTIDTNEIRIHKVDNWNNPSSDQIVAGMTSGKPVNNWESVSNTSNDPIRIWAGTDVDILDNNGENKSYSLNLENAKFKVRQSGKLEASDADVEGTIQANILRLGEDSFISGTNTNNSRTLPKLENNKILMFYVLTDEMSSGTFALSPEAGDKIKYLNASNNQFVTTTSSVSLKPKKLYLLFGIDHNLNENTTTHELIWHLVELNLASITVTSGGKYVDPSFYDVDFYVELSDELRITDQTTLSGILLPSGKVHLSITNRFSSNINVYVSPITLTLQYSQDGTDNTTYAYSINIENFSFTVGKSLSASADAGYGTKSNSYTNRIGLNCTYEANEDLAGYQVGFEPKALTETDFAEFDLSNQNKINIKKAVISATY